MPKIVVFSEKQCINGHF